MLNDKIEKNKLRQKQGLSLDITQNMIINNLV